MGTLFSKYDTLEFLVLPSDEVTGPLGLGDPDSEELTAVERETLIPALMNDQLRAVQCRDLWDSWSVCRERTGWSSALFCRDQFFEALTCNKRHFHDAEFLSSMTELYLQMRANYRRTGVEKRVVRTDRS